MATVYELIEPRTARWIGEQPVFFEPLRRWTPTAWSTSPPNVPRRSYRAEKNEHSLDGLPGLAGLPSW